jgi:ubiquinone/menaquinone biosynthesis C-methylase UbiE
MANESTFYADHWHSIEDERFERYQRMFVWRDEQAALIEALEVATGHRVLDFGCGPGFLTAELARRVGPSGYACGADINARFVADANRRAEGTPHLSYVHLDGEGLPFDDASFDRALAKNVLEYVPDLGAALRELNRVLSPGGRVHTIDSDWGFVIVEPWSRETTERVFAAAAPAYREPLVGRKLASALVAAGFTNVDVRISATPDRRGGTLAVMRNTASYVKAFGRIPNEEMDALIAELEHAVESNRYLFVLPQFLVTGEKARTGR